MSDKKKILVFDFDGTLTTKDTLIEFIRYAKSSPALLFAILLFSPLLVLMKLHLADNGKTKQRLFSYFFKEMSLEDFNAICNKFGKEKSSLLRQGGKTVIASALKEGTPVYIVSASIDNWVKPFFSNCNIIGTKLEVKDDKLTGRFLTKNCYGAEKVNRLKAAIPDLETNRSHYYIIAYGDSRGDKEILEYADEGHYKPFR